MARPAPTSIADHSRKLPDPRVRRTRRHALVDILVITRGACIIRTVGASTPAPSTATRWTTSTSSAA
jgi:hypothetical protein